MGNFIVHTFPHAASFVYSLRIGVASLFSKMEHNSTTGFGSQRLMKSVTCASNRYAKLKYWLKEQQSYNVLLAWLRRISALADKKGHSAPKKACSDGF
jgi:hypothetical protein